MSIKKIIYGSYSLEYKLTYEKRKTLKLSVQPDMTVLLACPLNASDEKIEAFIKRKWQWIDTQIKFFGKYQKKVYRKEYQSGESFYYLGRQYQLVVKKSKEDKVSLSRGILLIETSLGKEYPEYTKKLLAIWFKERSHDIFRERFDEIFKKFGYKKEVHLRIAQMKRKWGNCDSNIVTLNPRLIQASKDCIDYVITHELCHIRYKNHNKNFFTFLDKMFPHWELVKEKLESRFL